MTTRVLLCGAAMALLVSCGNASTTGAGGAPTSPPPSRPASGTPAARGAVAFRVLLERQSASYCVEGPEFALATTREQWFGVAERQWSCQPTADPAEMIVDWDEEVGVAAWWGVRSCLGHSIRTDAVRLAGATITVEATSRGPDGACAQALGGLESFLALARPAVAGATTIRFVLNGEAVGSIEPRS